MNPSNRKERNAKTNQIQNILRNNDSILLFLTAQWRPGWQAGCPDRVSSIDMENLANLKCTPKDGKFGWNIENSGQLKHLSWGSVFHYKYQLCIRSIDLKECIAQVSHDYRYWNVRSMIHTQENRCAHTQLSADIDTPFEADSRTLILKNGRCWFQTDTLNVLFNTVYTFFHIKLL